MIKYSLLTNCSVFNLVSFHIRRNFLHQTLSTNFSTSTKKMSEQNCKNLISICHMRATSDKAHNLKQVKEIVRLSKERNAKVCF